MAELECWCTHMDWEHLDAEDSCWGGRGYCACVKFKEFTAEDKYRLENPRECWINDIDELTHQNIQRRKKVIQERQAHGHSDPQG